MTTHDSTRPRPATNGGQTEATETAPPTGDGASPVGFLDPDDCFTRPFCQTPFVREHLVRIDQYDLLETELSRFAGVVISSHADQDYLYRHRDVIREFLDVGGVVVFSGHLATRWLPGAAPFVPRDIEDHTDYVVSEVTSHPVFDGVSMDDLTYQRGVAGFFARGHNPPPAHATAILELPGGEPVVYVDDETTDGTIFAHSGNDLIGFGRRETSAARVPRQLVSWIRTESDVAVGGSPEPLRNGEDRR
ncbi:phosphate starvation-inducible protein PhoH [Haloferax volcanii]|uniref:phosphate starvation-inducible protein PhoH n=1 Tax=Haloferax volcanii TaxID=2246 RepID=UPI00249B9F2C|nr:phosphate starvation-inducible protein PhoH [Haloferax alexandrinus]